MLSEYIRSLADVSFHIVASMYVRFQYSGKNLMRFAVFWRICVRFCGFQTPLTPPSMMTSKQRLSPYFASAACKFCFVVSLVHGVVCVLQWDLLVKSDFKTLN